MRKAKKIMELPDLVSGLKKEDKRNEQMTKRVQWLMWILVPIYAVIFFLGAEGEMATIHRIMGASYIIAFIIFALYFKKYNKDYKSVDYALPTLEMLKKAAYRYRMFHNKSIVILIPVLLIDFNTCIYLAYDVKYCSTVWQNVLLVQVILLPLVAIGLGLGLLFWYKRQKPLRDNALMLINDIEGE